MNHSACFSVVMKIHILPVTVDFQRWQGLPECITKQFIGASFLQLDQWIIKTNRGIPLFTQMLFTVRWCLTWLIGRNRLKRLSGMLRRRGWRHRSVYSSSPFQRQIMVIMVIWIFHHMDLSVGFTESLHLWASTLHIWLACTETNWVYFVSKTMQDETNIYLGQHWCRG